MKRLLAVLFLLASSAFAQPSHGPISGGGGGAGGPATELQSPVVIEGTADAFEGNFTFADPTADWTWAWTGVGQLQGNYIELAHGTGANFYADTAVTLSVNRGGGGIPFAVYNSDDGLFVIENQGAASGFASLASGVPLRWAASGSAGGTTDTQIERAAVAVVKITDALSLTCVASPPRACSGGTIGDIYCDTSLALCFCDGTTFQVLNPLTAGVGGCS